MRHIVIGDVHGCLVELKQLLEQVKYSPHDDVLVFVGDLIHKGPDSEAVVAYVEQLKADGHVELIMGNHEEKHVRWHDGTTESRARMQHTNHYNDLSLTDTQWQMLRDSHLWTSFTSGGQRFTVVHGGVPPEMLKLPTTTEYFKIDKRDRKYFGQILRTRYTSIDGGMVAMGHETSDHIYWAELYDGRFGFIFFGHQSFDKLDTPKEYDHASGIDLGCVHGNKLCAALVTDGVVAYHTVDALQKYCDPLGLMNRIPE